MFIVHTDEEGEHDVRRREPKLYAYCSRWD
jgi:hypothetical protein